MAKANKAESKKAKKANKAADTEVVVTDTEAEETSPKKWGKAKKDKKGKAKAGKVKTAHDKPALSKAAIEKRIVAKIEAEAKTSIEIGVLLEQAKHYFYEGSKLKGALHIDWAKENFGFAKSQVHKYIKIGMVFGDLEGFDGVPMSVLSVMSSDDNILKAALVAMKEAKKDNDESFKIDNVWLKGYRDQLEQERLEKLETEELTLAEQLEAMSLEEIRVLYTQLTGEDAGKKQEKGLRSKIAGYADEDVEKALFDIEQAAKAEAEKNAKVSKAKFDKLEADYQAQKAELEAQQAELEAALSSKGDNDGGAELMSCRDKLLHKMMSKQEPHVLLGCAADANKRDVNKAKRALEPIYSPKHEHGCESIWLLIEAAVEALTA